MFSILLLLGVVAIASAGQESCQANEQWTECTGCEMKCTDPENMPCTMNCRPPSCECSPAQGFRRDADGHCIPQAQCPQHRMKKETDCAANESWTKCGTCEGTCAQKLVRCDRMCRAPGCYCLASDNMVRDGQGNCIPFDQC